MALVHCLNCYSAGALCFCTEIVGLEDELCCCVYGSYIEGGEDVMEAAAGAVALAAAVATVLFVSVGARGWRI
eukprot:1225835-Ditylum_brightwellii.AAC.1